MEVRTDGMYISCESLPVKSVDLSIIPDKGIIDPVFTSPRKGSNPILHSPGGVSPGGTIRGPLRALVPLFCGGFCRMTVKTAAFLHTFFNYTVYRRFKVNGAVLRII